LGHGRRGETQRHGTKGADGFIVGVVSVGSRRWEIAIKFAFGSLPLPKAPSEYLPYAQRLWRIQTLNITQEHALRAGELPAYHRDPFDRMIIAQALSERMTLLTADRVLQKYKVDLIFCGK